MANDCGLCACVSCLCYKFSLKEFITSVYNLNLVFSVSVVFFLYWVVMIYMYRTHASHGIGSDTCIYASCYFQFVCLLEINYEKMQTNCVHLLIHFSFYSQIYSNWEKKTLESSSISYDLLTCFQASITSWWTKKFQRTSKERCLAVLLMWHINHQLTW